MENFIRENLNKGAKITMSNESTFTTTMWVMECSKSKKTFWLDFNGRLFSFKTFDAFFKKFNQLKKDFSLELKSW